MEHLYLHIPFCRQKCRYCDFLSFGNQNDKRMMEYVEALITEMTLINAKSPCKPKTIFIGGGTPSFLPEAAVTPILAAVKKYFVSENLQEYTIEANPESLNRQKLRLYRQMGINRLSLGVQSIAQNELTLLGRNHSFQMVKDCLQSARAEGFANISLDLMYGLPEQTIDLWQKTVEEILALDVEHLSLYQLKIEENTLFGRWLKKGQITEFDDETAFEMYSLAQKMLFAKGFHQYEISNYAKAGQESQHNKAYWQTKDYLGLGIGAHSFVSPSRFFNPAQWNDYCLPLSQGRLPKQGSELLSAKECMEETVFMGLRMNEGVSLVEFFQRYGEELTEVFAQAIAKGQKNGWLFINEGYLRLTDLGRVLGDLVFVEFI